MNQAPKHWMTLGQCLYKQYTLKGIFKGSLQEVEAQGERLGIQWNVTVTLTGRASQRPFCLW